jgi:hypothetical protein
MKIKQLIIAILLFMQPALVFAQAGSIDPAFTPSKLIDDKVFSDIQTFGGAAGIQKFLETKGSVLANTSPNFLTLLKEPDAALLKQGLEDPEPNLSRLRTASELIWDASVQSGLNPQVILVTLNKEQGLITSSQNLSGSSLQTALDHALGFACPDSGGCGSLFPGFYYQLFGNFDSSGNRYLGTTKSLMKSFSTPGGRGPQYNGAISHVGDTITLDNTLGGYDGVQSQQTIQLTNQATAALYRFTPHVFNGNYNFWRFFNAWFKYPNGTLLKTAAGLDTYIIQNGVKQLVPAFVAQARGLNLANIITVSPTEFDSYQTDVVLGPVDNTIVAVAGQTAKYVFLNNVSHQASDLVLKQRGLDPAKLLAITPQELTLYTTGAVLPPKDGTVVRGTTNPAIYLVADGKIKAFSAYTFAQHKISAKQVILVPDAEIVTYAQNGFVPPLDGSLVKSSIDSTIYLVQNGLKEPVLGDVFKNQRYSFKNVAIISSDEMNALAAGSYAPPKDLTFFAVESKTGPLYEYKDGTKHSISSFVAKQRNITPDYVFGNNVAVQWFDGIPVPPKDGTIIKGDNDGTVYLVANGQLKPLTYAAYLKRKITPKKTTVLSQIEVDAYAKGDAILK